MWTFKTKPNGESEVDTSSRPTPLAHVIEQEQKRIKTADNMIESMMKATPAVDFALMKAVSVERIISKYQVDGYDFSIGSTIIGYIAVGDVDGQFREWTIHCSSEHHENLVKEFNAYKKINSK